VVGMKIKFTLIYFFVYAAVELFSTKKKKRSKKFFGVELWNARPAQPQ